ncbi:MAG: 6-phosphogluconolactonase, partial [Muribaculaceae bacterium]|nr:6-phosphogluconolactonase [Muribaculaceae bacterium]
MKTNLSSQISLERIPKRYFAPADDLELATLRREEKIYSRIFENMKDGSAYLARHVVELIKKNIAAKNRCVIALGAGRATHSVYANLIDMYNNGEVSFDRVVVFNLSEFYPIDGDAPSTLKRLNEVFLSHVNVRPENIHSINPNLNREEVFNFCTEYEQKIADCGGLDLTLCEIGPQGDLGFNQPGSLSTSVCRLVLLSPETRMRVKKEYKTDKVPATAIALGLKNILKSSRGM